MALRYLSLIFAAVLLFPVTGNTGTITTPRHSRQNHRRGACLYALDARRDVLLAALLLDRLQG